MPKCENCGEYFSGAGERYDVRQYNVLAENGYVCSKRCAREMEEAERLRMEGINAEMKEKGVGGMLKDGAKKDLGIIYWAFAGIFWILKKLVPMIFKAVFFIALGIYKMLANFFKKDNKKDNESASTDNAEEIEEVIGSKED